MDRGPDDLSVRVTAGIMVDLFHQVDRAADDPRTREEVMAGLLRALPSSTTVMPVLPGAPAQGT
jgi:hypothetical protein